MGGQLLHEIVWSFVFLSLCSAQCTFPTSLRGPWLSSEIGANELEFASSSFSGYTVHTYGTLNFTCEIQTGTKYVVKSEAFQRFGLDFNAYMCLDLTAVTDSTTGTSTGLLYKYYKATDELKDAGYERVKIWLSSKVLNTYTQICTVSDYTNVPYSMLMANDTIANNTITCPIPFLGVFGYTYDTGSGNLCSANNSDLDVCSDKTTMTWNYTLCSQIQAYSSGGVVNCLYYSNETTDNGTVYTLHVYNQDATVDQSTNYRFTCYKVTGYGTVYATQSPGDCVSGQNETYVTSPGGTLVLTASVLCAYDDTPSTSSTDVLSAGAIAGIAIACFLIIIAIAVFFGFRWYRKREREKQEAWEAENRKVDPDELSPNMRLGLPDESKYDLDRLMYSPIDEKSEKKKFSKKIGTGKGKGSRRSMKLKVPTDRMESYNEGDYMDESQRQTALDATLFAEKRKRKDGKDEFKANDPKSKQYADRVKEIAKGKKRPFKLAALAKLRLRPKAKPILNDPSEKVDGNSTQNKDIVIQVEEAEVENKRRTRFADEEPTTEQQGKQSKAAAAKKSKALEDIDTLSDILDNELGVNDLSDEEKEPRLKLPNLNPKKPERKKRSQDKYSLVSGNQRTSAMPLNTKFMPPKSKLQTEDSFVEPMPLIRNAPNLSSMPPLQRIHRKESSSLWRDALGDKANGKTSMEELKKGMSENQWRKLLEELYRDKKYFDYVKKTSSKNENELGGMADDGLQFLYGRALFWEEQQPIPARPPSSVRRMYSRHDSTRGSERRAKSSAGLHRSNTGVKRSANLKRSATTLSGVKSSGYGFKTVPRTPSTQVSRLRRREGKQAKDNANDKLKNDDNLVPNGGPKLAYFDGGTQTEFSPPMSPLLLTDSALDFAPDEPYEKMSLPGSVILEEEGQSIGSPAPSGTFIHPPPKPIQKEVTKSDIQLEEVDNDIDQDYNYGAFGDEEVTIAI